MKCDFGETRIKELEKEVASLKSGASDLITLYVVNMDLQDFWRKKFSIELPKINGEIIE